MRKMFLLFLVILFSSIIGNIYLLHKSGYANNTVKYLDKTEKTTTSKEEVNGSLYDSFINNPIQKFFDSHELANYSTPSMSKLAYLQRELWKIEMDHAYDALVNAAHKDIKDSLRKSQKLITDYAEVEAAITCAVGGSDAFGDESGEIPEKIHYGTIHGTLWNVTIANLYENKTKDLYNYCQRLGIKIYFVFTEKSLKKFDLPPLIKK